jgi:alcohol dehydrogenase class IV
VLRTDGCQAVIAVGGGSEITLAAVITDPVAHRGDQRDRRETNPSHETELNKAV